MIGLGVQPASAEMTAFLTKLRSKVHIGMVGGSDLVKQKEQLGDNGMYTTTLCLRQRYAI